MGYLLVLNEPDAVAERAFAGIAAAARLELVTTKTVAAALAWLEAREPSVVVFDAHVPRAERLCNKVRSNKRLATVPLIALVNDTSNAFVERLYGLGADDVISSSLGPSFLSRVRNLPDKVASSPERGMAVVADSERERCNVIGRVLSNAGYDVKFAHDEVALSYYTQNHKPRLVVSSGSLGPPRQLITAARRRGCAAPWIVAVSRRDLVKQASALSGLERVSVVAASSTPETVLFASNELLRGELPPTRAFERHLYGSVVWFRGAGEEFDDLGFTYNVSEGGLFVRTLAPPERDRVWLELRPPRSLERVRLEGRVAWRRPYVPTSAATGPPGFGICVTGALGDGVDLWRAQCRAFGETALSVAKLHAARREDARTSGEYMLLEVPSESRLAVVRVVSDASTEPPPAASPTPIAADPAPAAPPLPPPAPLPRIEEPEHPIPLVASSKRRVPPEKPIPLVKRGPLEHEESAPVPERRLDSEPPMEVTAEEIEVLDSPSPSSHSRAQPSARPETGVVHTVRAPPRKRRLLTAQLVGYMLIGVAGGAVAAILVLEPSPPSAAPTLTTQATTPPVLTARAHASAVAAESASASASARPAPASAADGGTLARADAAAPLPPEPSVTAAAIEDLPVTQGYLVVRSHSDADVYGMGVKIGVANQPNRSHCGLRWVRLGHGDPPSWISRGMTVDVKCRSVTSVELDPGPFEDE